MSSTIVSSTNRPFSPPFHYEELTNEPYLPLPAPLGPRFRLTPPRISDTWPSSDEPNDLPTLIRLLNIPAVNSFLTGPPFPFTADHAMARFLFRKQSCERALRNMEEVATATEGAVPDDCPVTFIRERLDDGTDVLIGDCCIHRSRFHEILDPEERAQATAVNLAYEAGDPRIVYGLACERTSSSSVDKCSLPPPDFLSPTHQGRGIMSAAVSALINDWAIPHMRAERFVGSAMSHNIPSQKVFLKNGFKPVEEKEDSVDLAALGKGEGKVGLRVYERRAGAE